MVYMIIFISSPRANVTGFCFCFTFKLPLFITKLASPQHGPLYFWAFFYLSVVAMYIFATVRQVMEMSCQHLSDTQWCRRRAASPPFCLCCLLPFFYVMLLFLLCVCLCVIWTKHSKYTEVALNPQTTRLSCFVHLLLHKEEQNHINLT